MADRRRRTPAALAWIARHWAPRATVAFAATWVLWEMPYHPWTRPVMLACLVAIVIPGREGHPR